MSVDSAGSEADDDCFHTSISADGQVVGFTSFATNLVAGDSNGDSDVFVHDRSTGETTRVSVDSAGREGSLESFGPALSADGQVVAFTSHAFDLVSGDKNGRTDVFVHDRATGITTRVSVDSLGAEGDDDSYGASLSADGQLVAFASDASNLVPNDTNDSTDVFVHDRGTGSTERVSVDSAGFEGSKTSDFPAMTADGQIVAFQSGADNLVAGDKNGHWDVFVHDRGTGTTTRVSVDSSGSESNANCRHPSISGDGRAVAFESGADNLVPGDNNDWDDVFVHDRATGTTTRASVDSAGAEGNQDSGFPALSGDGQFVAFSSSSSNFVAGDTNHWPDVFVHDRSTGATTLSSMNCSGAIGNEHSTNPSISSDGQVVSFLSTSDNLVFRDTNLSQDVFVEDRTVIETDDPSASFRQFGAGPLTLSGSVIGPCEGDVELLTTGAPSNAPIGILLIGLAGDSAGASHGRYVLYVDLSSPFVLMTTGSYDAAGTLAIYGQIPPDSAIGAQLFLQTFALGVTTRLYSNGLELTIVP